MAELRTNVATFLRLLLRIFWDIAPERMRVDEAKQKQKQKKNMLNLLLACTLQWSSCLPQELGDPAGPTPPPEEPSTFLTYLSHALGFRDCDMMQLGVGVGMEAKEESSELGFSHILETKMENQ